MMHDNRSNLMTSLQQMQLTQELKATFDRFMRLHNLTPKAIIHYLAAYLWGAARADGWSSRELWNYLDKSFNACNKREKADSLGTNLRPPGT